MFSEICIFFKKNYFSHLGKKIKIIFLFLPHPIPKFLVNLSMYRKCIWDTVRQSESIYCILILIMYYLII